ncbi:TMEM175 family protein [Hymenobacter jejuensis]|uniref:DUF1211 domain-containing protein n=1 Tax=Hymenobacter jejuensis TaxID=2502781 RepID=A0A5B7ZYG3_9BACT|nr:TMEM175 family protein [Hymenobacter jejuensis]QDA59927.1 DUF1211 domain-containing protein [Hymenobacter jejuensis]
MSHSDERLPLQQDDRMEFQVERMILFTDAVFAIAITLLIIEIKVPEMHHPTEQEALGALFRITPKFVGFFIGFFIIAIYWVAHHRIFRFVHSYDSKLIWINILFLLSIVVMPFTTAFQSEYVNLKTPWIVYSINVAFTGFMQVRLQSYLRDPANGIVRPRAVGHPDLDLARPLMSPAVFLLSILLAYVLPGFMLRMLPMVLFPLFSIYVRRRYNRQAQVYNHQITSGLAA